MRRRRKLLKRRRRRRNRSEDLLLGSQSMTLVHIFHVNNDKDQCLLFHPSRDEDESGSLCITIMSRMYTVKLQ